MLCVYCCSRFVFFVFHKQKTAYEMRISDWSSDVCSSDLIDDQRLIGDPLQQMRGGDIAKVKRRVLPHEHHIDITAKVDLHGFAKAEMRPLDRFDRDRESAGRQAAVPIVEV